MTFFGSKEKEEMIGKMMDERTERINGLVSFYVLMLTQIALAGVIVYKGYILGLPSEEYNEVSVIMGLSMGGYWALRLYFSGILPMIPFKKLVVIYFVSVALIWIPTYLMVGWPEPSEWYQVLYPFIGVAVVLGFYSLVAYLGKRRLEKSISE
jgi:hypothetical protein